MFILGIHKDPWHNTGAALIRSEMGKTDFVFISEERLNRQKDSRAFPEHSINACLKEFGLSRKDQVDLVMLDYIRDQNWRVDFFKTQCVQVPELNALPEKNTYCKSSFCARMCNFLFFGVRKSGSSCG